MAGAERRAAERTHNEQWSEAKRNEFRKAHFLSAVEVDELDAAAWSELLACFEGRHIRFI